METNTLEAIGSRACIRCKYFPHCLRSISDVLVRIGESERFPEPRIEVLNGKREKGRKSKKKMKMKMM